METIFFESTDTTPLAEGKAGRLVLEGKALPEDPKSFFDPLFDWMRTYDEPCLVIDVDLFYFNTAASKQLHDLFHLAEANENIESIRLNWHYETGDEETLESGEIYEKSLKRTDFNYIEYAES
jgi:hypothetical protein